MRRDLEKDVVGRRIKAAEVKGSRNAMRVIRRHGKRKDFTSRLDGSQADEGGAPGQVRAPAPRFGRRPRHPFRDERAVPAGERPGRHRAAHPRGPHVPAGWGPPLHRPADVRRDVRHQRGRARQGQGAPAHRDRPARPGLHVADLPVPARAAWRQDEAALDGSEVHQRAGEHLLGRGLVRGGIRYDRLSDTLSSQEVRRLYRAIQETVQDAIKMRGTTLDDEAYVDLFGKPGEYQGELKVYGREGEPCRRCRTPIQTVKVSQRTSYFCPQCQS